MNSLDRLLSPRSVALIGASNDPDRIGGRAQRHLREAGFAGPVYPINPGRETVQGVPAYRSILDIDGEIDCAVVTLPAESVLQTVQHCAKKHVKSLVIFSSGFAEMGDEGRRVQERLTGIARETGMRMLGPNCIGLFDVTAKSFLTFIGIVPKTISPRFNLGLVSQSGGYGSHLLRLVERRGLSTSHWVTTGNECDVEFGEVVEALAAKPEVNAIVGYIEGVRSRDNLLAGLELARRNKKPVIIMKVGDTGAGATAAASHTASLVGAEAIYQSIFKEFGVHRAGSTEEVLDIAYAASRGLFPDERVGVVTVSGGVGVQLADLVTKAGLELPAVPDAVQAKMKALVPYAATRNPVDVTAQFINDLALVEKCMDLMLDDAGFRTVVTFLATSGFVRRIADPLIRVFERVGKKYPDRLQLLSIVGLPEVAAELEAAGCVVFEEPARAINALGALVRFARAFAGPAPWRSSGAVAATAPAIQAGTRFNEVTAKEILAGCGVGTPPERLVRSAEEAATAADAVGYPVAVKIVSADILHKTEIGGVALGLTSADAVAKAVRAMETSVAAKAPQARTDGFLVSKMVSGGVECIIGVHRDPLFGPVVMFGIGGILVEVMNDVTFRLAPISEAEALAMIEGVRGYKLLAGYRGKPRADIPALAHAIAAVSRLAATNADRVKTIEINPVVALAEGSGILALDAVIE
jgi:acyl-CoA synthetase (NDP forming)